MAYQLPSKKKKCRHDTLTIKQAHHKNHALQAHLQTVHKVIDLDKRRASDDLDKTLAMLHQEKDTLREVHPLGGDDLLKIHCYRRRRLFTACFSIIHCYMSRQHKKMATGPTVPLDRSKLVTCPDHIDFVRRVFPEACDLGLKKGWTYDKSQKADIYEHSRAAHDMKCLSTRVKPVGAYGNTNPINVRFLRPHFMNMIVNSNQSLSSISDKKAGQTRNSASGSGHNMGESVSQTYHKLGANQTKIPPIPKSKNKTKRKV